MERSNLVPFVRQNLDILFVGLNPAKGSSCNRHYFSVNQAFWNQLFNAGLITSRISKSYADEIIFGGTSLNYNGWSYGITDLITEIAESDSSQMKPSKEHCIKLKLLIENNSPKVAILLHRKVLNYFLPFLGYRPPSINSGKLRKLIPNCNTMFYNIAFPHGNRILSEEKIFQYKTVKQYLLEI